VAIGDDVLVRLRSGDTGGDRVLLKELVKRTADELELRQFKPEGIFSVAAANVEAIDKVLGELI
jgi:hypothetical protein